MRQDNFPMPPQAMAGVLVGHQIFTTIRHFLWAIVLVLWVIPNSVEIIRILVAASNG